MLTSAPAHLSRFLPGALARWATRSSGRRTRSFSETHVGALMITDLSGFTRLTARLTAEQGKLGVERTSRILNAYVGLIVEIVGEVGGAVLSFEGDALVAGWRCAADEEEMTLAALSACACAELLRRRVEGRVIEGESFQLRSGVSVGEVELIHLVLAPDDRRLVLAGACMREVTHCATLAESGQILVSPSAWSRVRNRAAGRALAHDVVELLSVEDRNGDGDRPPMPTFFDTLDLDSYLPPVLRARPDWATSDWLAELRTVSSLFARITASGLPDDLDLAEAAMRALLREVTRHQGEVLRIAGCEGGLQALVGFGLPERSHHDDPARAALCALALIAEIRPLGPEVSVAVATGDVFCGALGTKDTAEYTVLGNSVNRAARLAIVAAGRALVDLATAERAADRVDFQGPYRMQVPGLRDAVPVRVARAPRAEQEAPPQRSLVDRREEYAQLVAWFEQPRPASTVVWIEGEAGVGKSALLHAFLDGVRQRGVEILVGGASDIEQGTPYFAFRRVVAALAGPREAGSEAIGTRLAGLLTGSPDQVAFLPLLENVLDLGLASNAVCDQMSASARAENLRRLLRQLLAQALSQGGLLAVEDAHWLDASSQFLIGDLVGSEDAVFVVATSRGGRFAWDATIHRIELAPLAQDDAAELACTLLDAPEIAEHVRDALWNRAGGNPFFVSELCRALKPTGTTLRVDRIGEDRLFALPQSARAAVLSRTDLLSAPDLLVLKIASALSTSFGIDELVAIRALERVRSHIVDCVGRLVSLHLLRPDLDATGRFSFSHAIAQEAVYSSMVSDQRRDAHAAIAESLERTATGRDAEFLPLILSHWQRAEDEHKTRAYLLRVAKLRLDQFDNRAATDLAETYLSGVERLAPPPGAGELAAAHFVRGEAALNLGRMTVAREAFERGLDLLGLALPQSRPRLLVGLVREAGRHLYGSARLRAELPTWRGDRTPPGPTDDEPILAAARAHQHLTQIYYFEGDKARLIHATLRAANLAEQASRVSRELAVNYASLGAICGVIPLRRRAERYLRLALRLSDGLGDSMAASRIHMLAGLYQTSVGEWEGARAHFEGALASSAKLGEMRRWCELAVGLETILNPGLLTAVFPGEEAWASLVGRICEIARERGDLQVLGCGLTAAVRGHRALGATARATDDLAALADLTRSQPDAVEPIHVLEGAALLEEAAAQRGDEQERRYWVERIGDLLQAIRPAMKSRTLPALTTVFTLMSRDRADDRTALARLAATKLERFARTYPIGLPRARLFRGDIEAGDRRPARAAAAWRQALRSALDLGMYADALAARDRLREARASMEDDESLWRSRTGPAFAAHPAIAAAAPRAAALLGLHRPEGGHGAS